MNFQHWILLATIVWKFLIQVGAWTGKLVFEDNFNGRSLDLRRWEYQEGCSEVYGARNLQCYTRRNIQVSKGILKITAKKEAMENKSYTSGRIRQRGPGFAYGAFVVRAKLARGDHLWPAIWTLSLQDECRYEEIDILEYRGQRSQSNVYEAAGHWGRKHDALISNGSLAKVNMDLSLGFHEYAILWLPTKIEWYFDNVKVYTVSLTDGTFTKDKNKLPCSGGTKPFDKKTNLILNMAVGGPFFDHLPPINPSTWTKPTMEIDWVRIYQE